MVQKIYFCGIMILEITLLRIENDHYNNYNNNVKFLYSALHM